MAASNYKIFHDVKQFRLSDWLIPRPLAWISYGNDGRVGLLNGFSAVCYHPLVLFFSGQNLPSEFQKSLANNRTKKTQWSLSLLTSRDTEALKLMNDIHAVYTHEALGLARGATLMESQGYPKTVASAPVNMFCSIEAVELHDDNDLVLLVVDSCTVDGSVLSSPSASMIERSISAKIDATLIDPLAWLGGGDTIVDNISASKDFRSLPRPIQSDVDNSWTSKDFTQLIGAPIHSEATSGLTWTPTKDGRSCALGFNPTTALVLSRPIGWISTYSKEDRVPHLAPYSFFMDVGVDLVAFSPYSSGASGMKDAHKDAEETGFFCYNMVTADLAVKMNYSAAPLPRDGSEFDLAGLTPGRASSVDAPVVQESPIRFECEYVETRRDIGGFSLVVGRVKQVLIDSAVLLPNLTLNTRIPELTPVARLGYTDEYSTY